jgi:hypothetical protein
MIDRLARNNKHKFLLLALLIASSMLLLALSPAPVAHGDIVPSVKSHLDGVTPSPIPYDYREDPNYVAILVAMNKSLKLVSGGVSYTLYSETQDANAKTTGSSYQQVDANPISNIATAHATLSRGSSLVKSREISNRFALIT